MKNQKKKKKEMKNQNKRKNHTYTTLHFRIKKLIKFVIFIF